MIQTLPKLKLFQPLKLYVNYSTSLDQLVHYCSTKEIDCETDDSTIKLNGRLKQKTPLGAVELTPMDTVCTHERSKRKLAGSQRSTKGNETKYRISTVDLQEATGSENFSIENIKNEER